MVGTSIVTRFVRPVVAEVAVAFPYSCATAGIAESMGELRLNVAVGLFVLRIRPCTWPSRRCYPGQLGEVGRHLTAFTLVPER